MGLAVPGRLDSVRANLSLIQARHYIFNVMAWLVRATHHGTVPREVLRTSRGMTEVLESIVCIRGHLWLPYSLLKPQRLPETAAITHNEALVAVAVETKS
jgi:hypothetical protein